MKRQQIAALAGLLDSSPGMMPYLDKLSAQDLHDLAVQIRQSKDLTRRNALNTARCPMNIMGGTHEFTGTAPHRECKGCHVREAV